MNKAKYDAIIVLGSSLTPDGYINDVDKARLQKVAELYKEGIANAIIVCGSNGYKGLNEVNTTEAEAYANYLQSYNIEPDAIYLEDQSKESLGNILFAKMQIISVNNWRKLLVIPTYKHSTERIEYLLKKILGPEYDWDILRIGESDDATNEGREALALKLSKEINDKFADGDTEAIYEGLMDNHPAYGGTRWTLDELREKMKG